MNKKLTFIFTILTILTYFKANATMHYRAINQIVKLGGTTSYDLDFDGDGNVDCTFYVDLPGPFMVCGTPVSSAVLFDTTIDFVMGFDSAQSISGYKWQNNCACSITEPFSPASCTGKLKYIMLKFTIGSDYHYGWVKAFTASRADSLNIISCGWNDSANTVITPAFGEIKNTNVAQLSGQKKFDYYIGKNELTISNMNPGENISMLIYDITGKAILSSKIINGKYPISLTQGMYIVKFIDAATQSVTTDKVIVQ